MTDNVQWIPILTSTLANAFDVMAPRRACPWDGDRDETQDIPPAMLDSLIEWFREADIIDDHSVGICACGAMSARGELLLAKDGKKYCPGCGGVGFVDSSENDEYGEPKSIDCPHCCGAGKLPIEQSTKHISPGVSL